MKEYLETLLQPYLITYRSFSLLPMYFQIFHAINQTSWKEIGRNSTKKMLFLITLKRKLSEILELDQHNVSLSMDSYLDDMNSILDIYAPYKNVNKYKLKFKIKLWITPALQRSIYVKNVLLKKLQ